MSTIMLGKAEASDVLHFTTLTAAINKMKSPNNFLQRVLFRREQTLPSEKIELSFLRKGREMAPLVRKNGEALSVDGYTWDFATVEGPNIRIKRQFTPSEVLFNRRPGGAIYANSGDIRRAASEHVARDLQVMRDLITNRIEYMCAQVIDAGAISYSIQDEENYYIKVRPDDVASNVVFATMPVTTAFWDDDAAPKPLLDIVEFKRAMVDECDLQPTICLCGTEAAAAIWDLARKDAAFARMINTQSGVRAGSIDASSFFQESGAIYIGNIAGIDFWEYGRTAVSETGSVPMLSAKYCYFINNSAAAQHVIYYAAIADVPMLRGRNFQTKMFSKAWSEEDPPALMNLVHTRPLPFMRVPGSVVKAKVVSTA